MIAVDSGFEACPSAGLGLGAILLLVLLAGTVPSTVINGLKQPFFTMIIYIKEP